MKKLKKRNKKNEYRVILDQNKIYNDGYFHLLDLNLIM